jgi:cytochrome c oxidase cbb3-type subunit 3
MIAVIIIEIIFIIVLLYTLQYLLRSDVSKTVEKVVKKEKSILEKINASVDIEEEEQILMEHDYDGIRELDNDLPPWWRYGFYLTILVSVVYLIHYHIALTGDLQITEYNKEVEKGKAEVAEYMKQAANNVDETNVKMLEGSEIAAGQDLFINTCATCHGKDGRGGVGPNLTDAYWVHGGSIVDIFKTIKYGWPDKGMKSWKEDLSPVQIAQITSFIRTIKGTNPPNGKAPQGDLYIEKENAPAVKDSTSVAPDSLAVPQTTVSTGGISQLK